MKLYRESMKKLGLVGIAMLAASVVMTVVLCISNAQAALRDGQINTVFELLPTLPYFAYAGGIAFAFVGFSFLNKRADSDFYHSLPVRRTDIFSATTLAALTWTVATVLLSVLASLAVYLFVGARFVPSYYPLSALFFIVATMLVYAAAALACSVTGTLITNIALTCIVLFLPRFILFMIGRSIVADVDIVGFWDLSGLLDPRTNIATGMLAVMRRTILKTDFVTLPNILYSAALAAIELVLGGWLFKKRPSELAERGAGNGKLQTLFACLLVLPVLLLSLRYIEDIRKLTIAIILIAGLAIYAAYQLLVLRNVKRMLRSLPWFACTAAVAFAVFFGMRAVNTAVLDVSPKAEEIRSVQFGLPEMEWTRYLGSTYNALLVSDIVFTEDEVKECVSENLSDAVKKLKKFKAEHKGDEWAFCERTFEQGATNRIYPVKITLNSGKVIRRTIEFPNANKLNTALSSNRAFSDAVSAYPNEREACYVRVNDQYGISTVDATKLMNAYFDEMSELSAAVDETFAVTPVQQENNTMGNYYTIGDEQSFGGLYITGYTGTHRFNQYINIRLKTPKTAALWMQLNNQLEGMNAVTEAQKARDEMATAKDGAYYFFSFNCTNVPMQNGTKQQMSLSYSAQIKDGKNENNWETGDSFIQPMLDLMKKGMLTNDPNAFNIQLFQTSMDERGSESVSTKGYSYLTFTSEDEAAVLKLMGEWLTAQAERERIYNPAYVAPEISQSAE